MNPHGAQRQTPTRIVVHAMGQYIKYESHVYHAREFLDQIGLSAHALIEPDGTLIRIRGDEQGAYHAKRFNKDSLGIEYLVPGVHDYRSFLQAIKEDYLTEDAYQQGKAQIIEWIHKWEISQIDRHSDIDPSRKSDPGSGFNFERLIDEIGA